MNKNIIVFNKTCIGSNHIKNNKVCEDASLSYSEDKLLFISQDLRICVVADGHGSDDYPRTDKGSKFATESVLECVKLFVKDCSYETLKSDKKNENLSVLTKSILSLWYEKVIEDYNGKSFTEEELAKVSEKYKNKYLSVKKSIDKTNIEDEQYVGTIAKAYGTTIVAFFETDKYCVGLQIGDGKCVAIDNDCNFFEPIPWDEQCQLNITTSLCDSNAVDEFRYYFSERLPLAVFCGCDGIDDSYSSIEQVYALYGSILKIFNEYGVEKGISEVEEYLPVLSKKGSGDDVSIAGIIDMAKLKEACQILKLSSMS